MNCNDPRRHPLHEALTCIMKHAGEECRSLCPHVLYIVSSKSQKILIKALSCIHI